MGENREPAAARARRRGMKPDRRQGAVARLIVALFALAIGAGTFYMTSELMLGWRIALAVIVAAPLLLLVDLLRAADALPRSRRRKEASPDQDPPPRPRSPPGG